MVTKSLCLCLCLCTCTCGRCWLTFYSQRMQTTLTSIRAPIHPATPWRVSVQQG
jgi:hypothetical protein